jgi:hypothetical protein
MNIPGEMTEGTNIEFSPTVPQGKKMRGQQFASTSFASGGLFSYFSPSKVKDVIGDVRISHEDSVGAAHRIVRIAGEAVAMLQLLSRGYCSK